MKTRLKLTPEDAGRRLSLDEFLDAEFEERGVKYELIGGRLDVSPEARFSHSSLQLWLFLTLHAYSLRCPDAINHVNPSARVFVPDLGEGVTAPEPDVAAYRGFPVDRPASEIDWQDVSPVLVVEVLSPGTEDKDLVRNRQLYLRVPSVAEYWILDTRDSLDRPALVALRRSGARWARPRVVAPGGTYTTPLLPGLTLTVSPRPL
ncbi:MAG: Uma2 family endonuclease [Gemmataceae bacterium]